MAILNDTIIHGDLYLKNSSKILLGAGKYKALRYNASNKQIILGDEKGNSEAPHTFITGNSVTLNSNKFLITSDKTLDIFTSAYITDNIITAVITNKTCFTNDTYFHNPLNSNTKVEVTADKVRVSDMLVSSTTTLLYNNTEISSSQSGNTSKIVNASGKNTISGTTNISGTTSISGITNTSGTTNISGTLKINTSDLQSTVKITKLSGTLQIDTSDIVDNHINYYGNIKFNDYIRMPISEGNNKFTIEKVCKVDINQSGSTNETVIHFGGDSHSSTNDTSSFLAASSIFNVSTVALFASSSYNYNSVISQYKADKKIISDCISKNSITAAIKTSYDAYKPSLVIDGNNIYMSNYATLPFSDDSKVSPPTIYLGKNTGEDAVTGLYGDTKIGIHRVNRQVVTIFGRLSGRYKGLYGKADPSLVYNGDNKYNNYAPKDTEPVKKLADGDGGTDEHSTGIPPVGGQIYFQIID